MQLTDQEKQVIDEKMSQLITQNRLSKAKEEINIILNEYLQQNK